METDDETDGLSITESAKQAGVEAFAKAAGKGTFDALADDGIFPEMAALWDCATVGELKACVVAHDQPSGAVNALLERARAAYLVAALTGLGVRQIKKQEQGR